MTRLLKLPLTHSSVYVIWNKTNWTKLIVCRLSKSKQKFCSDFFPTVCYCSDSIMPMKMVRTPIKMLRVPGKMLMIPVELLVMPVKLLAIPVLSVHMQSFSSSKSSCVKHGTQGRDQDFLSCSPPPPPPPLPHLFCYFQVINIYRSSFKLEVLFFLSFFLFVFFFFFFKGHFVSFSSSTPSWLPNKLCLWSSVILSCFRLVWYAWLLSNFSHFFYFKSIPSMLSTLLRHLRLKTFSALFYTPETETERGTQ